MNDTIRYIHIIYNHNILMTAIFLYLNVHIALHCYYNELMLCITLHLKEYLYTHNVDKQSCLLGSAIIFESVIFTMKERCFLQGKSSILTEKNKSILMCTYFG